MKVDHLSDLELALRPHRITGPVMAAFLDAAAIQPVAAMTYRPGTPAAVTEFERLQTAGVLKSAGAGHWFDLRTHYAQRREAEVRWMIITVSAALAIAAVAVMFYRG